MGNFNETFRKEVTYAKPKKQKSGFEPLFRRYIFTPSFPELPSKSLPLIRLVIEPQTKL